LSDKNTIFTPIGVAIMTLAVIAVGVVVFLLLGGDEAATPPETISAVSPETEADRISAPIVPSFDVVRISRGGTGVIAGQSEPGARVQLLADDVEIASVTADRSGEWVLILEEPLAPGSVELSIIAQLGEGEDDTAVSSDVVVVSVPERPEDVVLTNGVVAVLTPRDGSGPSRILQKPGARPVGEIGDSLTLDSIDYDANGRAMISGRAIPRAQVAIYLDNAFFGGIRADDEGRWTLLADETISDGEHIIRIDQIIGDGDVHLRIEQPFQTGFPIDVSTRTGKVVVQPGNSLWHIARRIYGTGVRYTLIFQENNEQIRDPDLIYPGQLFELPGFAHSQSKQGNEPQPR